MAGRRAPWLASAVLLLCAGLATGWATYLSWLPCRGAMLVGTILEPDEGEVPAGCYDRMDQGLAYETVTADAATIVDDLSALALLAAALAWLVLVIGLPWVRAERWCLLPLVVALGVAAVQVWLPWPVDAFAPLGALLVVDVAVLLAASALVSRMMRGDRLMVRAWITLLAVGSLGLVARLADYVVMTMWSQLNWDTPPGTGYLGAGVLVLAAIVVAATSVRGTPTFSGPAPDRFRPHPAGAGSLSR